MAITGAGGARHDGRRAGGRGRRDHARRIAPSALSAQRAGARPARWCAAGRDGLFDVLLSFERQDYQVSFGAAELVESRQLFSGTARYPLGITVCEFHARQDLELVLEASDAYFSRDEATPLAARIWRIVQVLAGQPDMRLGEIATAVGGRAGA